MSHAFEVSRDPPATTIDGKRELAVYRVLVCLPAVGDLSPELVVEFMSRDRLGAESWRVVSSDDSDCAPAIARAVLRMHRTLSDHEPLCRAPAPPPHDHVANYCRLPRGHAMDHQDGDRLFWRDA
jgi:hypothetical protein